MRLKSRTRTGYHSAFTAGTAIGTALAANRYRQVAVFQNNGTATLYFGFGTGITSTNALQLGTAATFILEQHVGPVYGFVAGGSTTIAIAELSESNSMDITSAGGTATPLGGGSVFVVGK
jgi:hypothetical protein